MPRLQFRRASLSHAMQGRKQSDRYEFRSRAVNLHMRCYSMAVRLGTAQKLKTREVSKSRVSELTLEIFRTAAAGSQPVPAGVAISAVSASFALALLAKVVTVASRRKDFSGDITKAQQLADSAKAASTRMLQYADADMTAFNEYILNAKLPYGTEEERKHREEMLASAARKAIETPMAAARAATEGIELCVEAVPIVHALVAADLGTAATLLGGALRVFLMCADSNVKLLAKNPSAYSDLMHGRPELETNAYRQAQSVLRQVTMSIEAAHR